MSVSWGDKLYAVRGWAGQPGTGAWWRKFVCVCVGGSLGQVSAGEV